MWKRTPLTPEIGKQLVRMQCLCGNERHLPSKIDIEAGSSATTGGMIMNAVAIFLARGRLFQFTAKQNWFAARHLAYNELMSKQSYHVNMRHSAQNEFMRRSAQHVTMRQQSYLGTTTS